MSEKSHVSLEHKICVVCGSKYQTDAILLDTRLNNSLPPRAITGWGMCEEHQKLKDDGFVALVGCDESRSILKRNDSIDPDGAFRTGSFVHLKTNTWDQIMNVPVPEGKVCFCEDEIIEHLKGLMKNAS